MPPTPTSGRTASAMTIMPRLPNHWSEARQKSSEGGRCSRSVNTVDPVVVRPDIVSKKARVKLRFGNASNSGIVADADINTHTRVTSRKPSRGFSSRRNFRVASAMASPTPELMAAAMMNCSHSPSPVTIEQPTGSTYATPKMASTSPRTCATPSMVAAALARDSQEELLDRLEMPAVGEEQDHVIVRLHDGVVMGHDDLFAAHDGADESAFRELDFGNGSTDDAGRAFIPVNNRFESFRRATA